MNVLIKTRRRSWYKILQFRFVYAYLNLKYEVQRYATFFNMLIHNKTIWYYDWTFKRLLIYNAFDYIRYVRVDLGETAYLNTKEGTVRAEKF